MERTYNGWKIITRDSEFWIYPPQDTWASDICDTLREAKELIDHYIQKEGNTMNIQDTIADIRANLTTYDDDTFKVLKGRLTMCMYGEEVSETLADEVIAESRRRRAAAKLEADRAEAEAWIEENAFAMVEDRPEQSLAFGVEYFDTDSLHEDFDGMDYFERMGLRAVTESKRTVYVDTGILEDRHTHPRYTDRTATSGHYYPLDGVLSDPARPVACAVIPYKGQPISKYSADCERATGRAQHIREQKALAEMANKDSQKVRRYAKKHQVSISAAIGALRGAGKLA